MTAALVEHQLTGHCEAARAAGYVLIYDVFEVRDGKRILGVCALGAYNAMAQPGERLSLPDPDADDGAFVAAWDAIEAGWDLSPSAGHPHEWWTVGMLLRVRFKPVSAESIGGAR